MCDIAVVALIIFTLLLFSLRSLVSPAPTNAPKPSVLSQSLLSDLEGLSLSNISSTVQVSVCACVHACIRCTQADISSINVCWESVVPFCLTLTVQQSSIWDGEMSLTPLWNISAPDANYWPFLPCYIYSKSGWSNSSCCFLYLL